MYIKSWSQSESKSKAKRFAHLASKYGINRSIALSIPNLTDGTKVIISNFSASVEPSFEDELLVVYVVQFTSDGVYVEGVILHEMDGEVISRFEEDGA